ncbi:MAG: zinc dependent phospholipase C family protein [Nanoarchaeota archaeon]
MIKKILFFILILSNFVLAWNWDTHQAQARTVFHYLPDDLQEKLNLSAIEYGSIIPDKEFKDFGNHHYPESVGKTKEFLDKTKETLNKRDFENASLFLGIASHYITDSFAAPHYTAEVYKLHKGYEDQASKNYYFVNCTKKDYSIDEILRLGEREGLTWQGWIMTKDERIPQLAAAKATEALIIIILNTFQVDCNYQETKVAEERLYSFNLKNFIIFGIVIAIIIFIIKSVLKDLKKIWF